MNKTQLRTIIKEEVHNLSEMKTITVEPNWEGVYRYFMYMKKTDPKIFNKVTGKMGGEWGKLETMAKKYNWKV